MKALTAPRVKLSEADVTDQCIGWLRSMQWRCVRFNTGKRRNSKGWTSYGEKGAADWFAYRASPRGPGLVEFIWAEFKRDGEEPATHQLKWLAKERFCGVYADYHDALNVFMAWYSARFGRHAGDAPGVGL